MRKDEKGITIIALTVTLVILGLISVPMIINATRVKGFNDYKKLKEDIDNLRENIQVAFYDEDISGIGPEFDKVGSLDFLNETAIPTTIGKNVNDSDKYYVISIPKLEEKLNGKIRELNYGSENSKATGDEEDYTGTDDVYVINEASRTIYYVKGIPYDGVTYHRLSESFSAIANDT